MIERNYAEFLEVCEALRTAIASGMLMPREGLVPSAYTRLDQIGVELEAAIAKAKGDTNG